VADRRQVSLEQYSTDVIFLTRASGQRHLGFCVKKQVVTVTKRSNMHSANTVKYYIFVAS